MYEILKANEQFNMYITKNKANKNPSKNPPYMESILAY